MHWAPVIVLVVLISGVVKIVQARHGVRTDRRWDERFAGPPRDDGEMARLRDDLARLRERVQVLERIVTDGDRNRGLALEREIESLRTTRPGVREVEERG